MPGEGPLTEEEKETVRIFEWADRYLPRPDQANLIKNRLLNDETVKVLTSVWIEVVFTRKRAERVAILSLLQIPEAHITDDLVERYPDLLNRSMGGVVELICVPGADVPIALVSFKPMQATVNICLFKQVVANSRCTNGRRYCYAQWATTRKSFRKMNGCCSCAACCPSSRRART